MMTQTTEYWTKKTLVADVAGTLVAKKTETRVEVMMGPAIIRTRDDMRSGKKVRFPSLGSSWNSEGDSPSRINYSMASLSTLGSNEPMGIASTIEDVTECVAGINLDEHDAQKPDAAKPDEMPADWWGWKWTLNFVYNDDGTTNYVYWTKEQKTDEEIKEEYRGWSYIVLFPREGHNAGIYEDYEEACQATEEHYQPRCFSAKGGRNATFLFPRNPRQLSVT